MSTALLTATSPTVLDRVGESWIQNNFGSYVCSKIPVVLCNDENEQRTDTSTYNLPKLSNFLLDKNGLRTRNLGDDLPPTTGLDADPVSFTVEGRGIPSLFDRSAKRSARARYADVKSNLVPGILALLYQGMGLELAKFLDSTDNFDNGTWTGGNVLDTFNSAVDPSKEIQNALIPYRIYQRRPGFKLECFIDWRVLSSLTHYVGYSGAGAGSAIASKLGDEEFIKIFKRVHSIDEVHVTYNIYNNAAAGQADNIANLGGGSMTFAIVDRRKTKWNLKSTESEDAPAGAIMLAMSEEPHVISEIPSKIKGRELFDGHVKFKFYNPRKEATNLKLGVKFSSAVNITP